MPLYIFSLDVPASPDVVAERLRAVVHEGPGLWESLRSFWLRTNPSGAPFLGSVNGNSFHLRRNITYSNSFLPLIHGCTNSVRNGARVRVVMFMHPLVFLHALFWLGCVGYYAWREFGANSVSSYIPLGMFIFGLTLSARGFFTEAAKARCLLSTALFNSAINTVAQPVLPQTDASLLQPEKSYSGFLRVAVAVCLLFLLNSVFKQYTNRLRACPAFAASMAIVSKAHAATAALGEPIWVGSFIRGVVHQTAESGYALLSIPVHGPKAKGTLYVVANRFQYRWDLERVALWTPESKRLDLSPPTRREDFRYPASSKIYLLPLDDAAALHLKDLPAYLAARLDLDVAVMPVLTPGPETVDGAAKQLIAEKVVRFIEQANPRIAGDLDSVMLGVTSQDLNIRSSRWGLATNYRRGRFGVLSTAGLQGTPWYAGHNPEVFTVRVRKMVTKNVALLRYPVSLSADATSALAFGAGTPSDVDEMGENFIGEKGTWLPAGTGDSPCVTITQGPGGRQSWMLDCLDNPPTDSRFELFENYTALPLFVMSRTDFAFSGQPSLPFLRMYRSAEDHVQTFGIGTSDSFTIFPAGDNQTFSYLDLILAAGERIHFERVSRGRSYANARLRADAYMGSPFSQASLAWNGNGWDMVTRDGWTYKFPASGPDRSVRESALLRIEAGSGQVFFIQRTPEGDLQRAQAPDGSSIEFTCDSMHRVIRAKKSSGRTVEYEYDSAGRLAHLRDSENGEEFYRYGAFNRLTAVLDVKGRSLLQNTYGFAGEITSQTLADGRTLRYAYGWDENRNPSYLRLTDPHGYIIQWWRTRDGILWSLPELPNQK